MGGRLNDREQGMTAKAEYVAPRTCRVVDERDLRPDAGKQTRLTEYADTEAYVLIAEPGAGKTTAFKSEAARAGAKYVSVRDFRTFDRQEWRDRTLFLDGLDESRAGASDGRTPLDEVRAKLDRLGCPRFRLSCRWGDWLAANDRERLSEVSPDGKVTVVRLDPLSEHNIKDILAKNHGVEDVEDFIDAARERGVKGLLSNPQNLELLAKSVVGGKWPASQLEMFEKACGLLAREKNGEHLAANPSAADTDPLIDAAGRLCATQLLAGNAGYTLPDRAEPDLDYPSLAEVGEDQGGRARQVLGTRIFAGVAEGKLAPAHRQMAEFLAARHVSGLVDAGLPLARVLALLTGFDGEVLPGFRNFLSWLGVHNKGSRKRIIRLDPSGLIYVGDKETYSTDEKREIVQSLRREWTHNPYCSRSLGRVGGFGRIVSPELEGTFREILTDPERAHEQQCYVLLLTQMLADGDPLPALSDLLVDMVRDEAWYPNVRCGALDVLTGYSERGYLESVALETLLREIVDGSIADPDDELLGILLKSLYPRVLPMAEVRKYLREPNLKTTIGEYSRFWTEHVRRESTPEQLAELLDGIAENLDEHRNFMSGEVGSNTGMARLAVEALEEALRHGRGPVAADRLYNWLGIFSENACQLLDRDIASLRFSLEWDALALKAIIVHAVETCLAAGEDCTDVVDRRLLGARPFGYGKWCMEMAVVAKDPRAAAFYLHELFDCVTDGRRANGLTVELARAGLASDEGLLRQFDRISSRAEDPATHREAGGAPEPEVEREKERQGTRKRMSAQSSGSKELRVSPQFLHRAAEAYLGATAHSERGTARQRLTDFVRGSPVSVDVLVTAMERTFERKDLPDGDDVVRLADSEKVNLLILPLMAGLHSLEQSGRLAFGDLNEDQRRLAITVLYTLPQQLVDPDNLDGVGIYRPSWFRDLLRDDPELVSDVLCRTSLRKLESGLQQPRELHELASAADHDKVAKLAAVRVLECFPKAETETALLALCLALRAALAHCESSRVKRVIGERLDKGGLGAAERSCWVVAGYLICPGRYREELRALTTDEERLKSLSRFVSVKRFRLGFASSFAADDILLFVTTVGAAYRKHGLTQDAFWSIADAIGTLSEDRSTAATVALKLLSEERDAEPWMPAIASAIERQASRRREREYEHSDIGQVVLTLKNGSPANAGDLAALVFDKLSEIAGKIRDESTSDWRQYWNVDSSVLPINPRPENACRDAILSDLQDRFVHLGVDAQPEGVYADDKKADIRVSFDGFNVPVEIKRSCHDDLWTAMQGQLIAKYTRDPGAAGYGIYLVFWFGDVDGCKPTSFSGWIPKTAQGVRQKLEELIPERKRNLISICLVDVSVPPDKRRAIAPKARTIE